VAARRVAIGVVTRAFGARGELCVRWLGDGPDTLAGAERIYVARSESDPLPRRHAVRRVAPASSDELRLELAGVRDSSDAEAYVGHLVLVDDAALPPLEPGEFYWHELVGYRVESTRGEMLGVVRTLWETGAHDLLVVDPPPGETLGADGEPLLIPTAREVLVEIDREQRRAVVDVVPGLLER